jgi:hypothetical protein
LAMLATARHDRDIFPQNKCPSRWQLFRIAC